MQEIVQHPELGKRSLSVQERDVGLFAFSASCTASCTASYTVSCTAGYAVIGAGYAVSGLFRYLVGGVIGEDLVSGGFGLASAFGLFRQGLCVFASFGSFGVFRAAGETFCEFFVFFDLFLERFDVLLLGAQFGL